MHNCEIFCRIPLHRRASQGPPPPDSFLGRRAGPAGLSLHGTKKSVGLDFHTLWDLTAALTMAISRALCKRVQRGFLAVGSFPPRSR